MEKIDHLNLTVKQLKLFLIVLESQSVGRAANELDLNQSTVSYSLDKLRSAFADPLFIKEGRGIVPTTKAVRIAPQIREILFELEGLASTDEYVPEEDISEITISANVMELLPYCKSIRKEISRVSPKATVRFLELGSRANIRQILETQAANIVISVRPASLPESLKSTPLLSFDQVCFYDHKCRKPIETVGEFCAADHATLDFGGTAKSTIDHTLEALSVARNVSLKASNIYALAELMKGTELITTMQSGLHTHAMRDFSFCLPPISVPIVYYDLIWHRRSQFSARNTWMRALIEEAVRKTLPT